MSREQNSILRTQFSILRKQDPVEMTYYFVEISVHLKTTVSLVVSL